MRVLYLALACLSASAMAQQPASNGEAQRALAETAGSWGGELQYRDYHSDRWMGLPMRVTVAAQPDGVTTVRTAQYDDGPQTGIVTITTVTLIDPAAATASYAIFRKRRATDHGMAQIVSFTPGAAADRWTMVTTETRKDGNKMARVRETTTREGSTMTILKEVDPEDDGRDEWLPRNRTLLIRINAE